MEFFRLIRRKLWAAKPMSLQDWSLFSRAWLLLLVSVIALRHVSLPRIQSFVRIGSRTYQSASSNHAAVADRVRAIVERAARNHLYPMTCLRQSLVFQWLLRRHGIESVLKFGVRREGFGIAAHSWVEYTGHSEVRAPGADGFTELVSTR